MARTRRRAAPAATGLLLWTAMGCGGQGTDFGEADLAAMIDSLLPGISEASGLEARRPLRYGLQTREEARRFITTQLAEEFEPGELEGMERAYKAFGLLPDTLDLRSLLLELYSEQVIGYYDPGTDHLYVVEGVARSAAAPVVAHELVHALQDQLVHLDSLVARERGNDRQLAAQAAAEGQATLVMVTLQVRETTGRALDPAQLPDLSDFLRPAVEAQNSAYPVFESAPRLIRETMLFPYVAGAAFVQSLHRAAPDGGPVVPFGELLPESTEQILDPEGRFLTGRDAPTDLRFGRAPAPWTVVYENTLGQLELSILLAEHLGTDAAASAEGWDGDRYRLLRGPGGREVLAWTSVWDDEDAADQFARTYRRAIEARPGWTGQVVVESSGGRPYVRVLEAAEGTALTDVPAPGLLVGTEADR